MKLRNALKQDVELSKTQMIQKEKKLEETSLETLYGEYSNIILSQSFLKSGHSQPTKYLIKTNKYEYLNRKDPEFYYYLEVLGARFYKIFSPESIMAKTRLVTRDTGEVNIGSRWIEDFIPYINNNTPVIQNGKVVITVDQNEYEVCGYISKLVTAKFIEDADAIGLGLNAGYLNKESDGAYKNVKIDPGRSFSFISDYNLKLGVVAHFTKKILNDGMNFHGHIPFDFLETNNPFRIDQRFSQITALIYYHYPSYDTRDLLIGEMTYAEISNHQNLYNQMASAIESIVSMTKEELSILIGYNMPNKINGEYLGNLKKKLFKQMQQRQIVMYQLYAQEVEYIKLYRLNPLMDFEEIKALALRNIAYPILEKPLMSNDRSEKILYQIVRNIESALEVLETAIGSVKSEKTIEVIVRLLHPSLYGVITTIENRNTALLKTILDYNNELILKLNNIITIERNGEEIHTTALMRAKDNPAIAKLLLDYGANPRQQVQSSGQIHDVTSKLSEEIQAMFLEKEARAEVNDVMQLLLEDVQTRTFKQDQEISNNQEQPFLNILNEITYGSQIDYSNQVILVSFTLKRLIESTPVIRYFSKKILHLPEIELPEFTTSSYFWLGLHYVACNSAMIAIGGKITVNKLMAPTIATAYYGVNFFSEKYLTSHDYTSLSMFLAPSSDNMVINNALPLMQLYNHNHKATELNLAKIVIPLIVDGLVLYNKVHNVHVGSLNLRQQMMIVDKTLLLMNYMRLVHYVAETTVTIIQDELFEPLIKYFSGEAEGLMVTAA